MFRLLPLSWLVSALFLAGSTARAQPPGATHGSATTEVAPEARIIPPAPDPSAPPLVPSPAAPVPGNGTVPTGPEPQDGEVSLRASAPAGHLPEPQAAFDRALLAYKAGAIEEARREFLAIAGAGHLSAALAHNLGNIEFRRGNPGQATLWYRRALAIQPFSPETLQNLRTLRRQQGFLSFDPFLLSFSHLSPRWLTQGTILTAWLAGLLLVWLLVVPPAPGRRWPVVVLLVLVLPVLALGTVLTWQVRTDPHPLAKRLVVSGKDTQAYAAPAEASSTVIRLPAGSELLPLEVRGNWTYCIIPGGDGNEPLRGWIRTTRTTEPLWPWPGGPSADPARTSAPTPDPSAT